MALNREFRVKDDINVLGRILSAGEDLYNIFSQATASFEVSAYNSTFYVSGGDAFKIEGGNGIDVRANTLSETLTVSGIDASYTQKGVASFSSSNFTVTDGAVSVASQGIGNTNLAYTAVNYNVIDPTQIVYENGAIYFTVGEGFSARVDNDTIGINGSNELYIPSQGVDNAQLATDAVTKDKIADAAVGKDEIDETDFLTAAPNGLSFTQANGLSARVDKTTIDIDGNNDLYVKNIPANVPITVYSQGAIIHNTTSGLSANIDDSTITISGNALSVKTSGISGAQLHPDVVDDVTLEYYNAGQELRVKDAGISNAKLAATAVQKNVIDASQIVYSQGAINFTNAAGFSARIDDDSIKINGNNDLYVADVDWGIVTGNIVDPSGAITNGTNGLSANVDNSTIEIASNTLQVKDSGITNNKLQYSYITVTADDDSQNINLGETLSILGTTNQINTANTLGSVQISLPNNLDIPGNLYVDNGDTRLKTLSVTGNFFVAGSAVFENTVVTTTSALSIINTGPSPALFVVNTNENYDIASFYDSENYEVLHIGGGGLGGGAVGINVGTPTNGGYQPTQPGLTVNGIISASGIIYTLDAYSSVEWASTYTSVSTTSANWDSVYASVQELSAGWSGGGSLYTVVTQNSANWDSVYSSFYSNSAQYLKDNTAVRVDSITVQSSFAGPLTALTVKDIFYGSANSDSITVNTFDKTAVTSVKYHAQIRKQSSSERAVLEILAVKNNTSWEGTVYGIVDQGNSPDGLFNDVQIDDSGSYLALIFTLNGSSTYHITVVGDGVNEIE